MKICISEQLSENTTPVFRLSFGSLFLYDGEVYQMMGEGQEEIFKDDLDWEANAVIIHAETGYVTTIPTNTKVMALPKAVLLIPRGHFTNSAYEVYDSNN